MRRFELRYWDGTQWTEHVARNGQVASDPLAPAPPVAATDQPAPSDTPAATSVWDTRSTVEPEPVDDATATQPGDVVATGGAPAGFAPTPEPFPTPPPVAQPVPQYAPPRVSAPMQASVAGLAIASMVLGIVWIYWVGSILAIIFGHIALGQIKRSNGWKTGKGMAIAGLTLGYVGLATLVLVIVVAVTSADRTTRFRIETDPSNGVCNENRFITDPDC